jgi:hypothetical protein
VKQRSQLRFLHRCFQSQQAAELRVAVLLDHEQHAMVRKEALNVFREGKPAYTHVVHADAMRLQNIDGLANRPIAAPKRNDGHIAAGCRIDHGAWHQLPGRVPLLQEPVDDELVVRRVLGVGTVLVVPGPAREIGGLRAHSG